MKVQIASDLHTEFWRGTDIDILSRVGKTDADVIVLAGDIGSMVYGQPTWVPHVNRLSQDRQVPIVKISGNHEYYGGIVEDVDDAHATLARFSDGQFYSANPGVFEIKGFRFIVATLWAAAYATEDRAYCEYAMNDYRQIATKAPKPGEDNETELFVRRFQIEDSERLNALHTDFIHNQLAGLSETERGRTVVVTHHTPSAKSKLPRYRGGRHSGCYFNNLDAILDECGPALWIHGHTHGSADYTIGATRVVANPLGYPDGWRPDPTQPFGKDGMRPRVRNFENPEYRTDFVVEV